MAGWAGEAIVASKVALTGDTDVDADELVGTRSDAPATKLEMAAAVIRYALRDGDWPAARTILGCLAGEDISERRIQEAGTRVGVERRREAMGGPVRWRLSQDTAGQRDFYTENQHESGAVPRASGSRLDDRRRRLRGDPVRAGAVHAEQLQLEPERRRPDPRPWPTWT